MHHRMTNRQLITLVRYLEAHRQLIDVERPSHAAVARQASIELGFTCSASDVRTAAEAGDLAWSPRGASGGGRESAQPPGHDVRLLARAIAEMADQLNIKIDQDVRRIASGRQAAR